jgi:tRNA(Ile)-lysidine synthetase-like protein
VSGTGGRTRPGIESAVDAALRGARIADGSVILAAVSGGPDSTALLCALAALRSRRPFALAACIVDHGIRSADAVASEIAFARQLCHGLQVLLVAKAAGAGECERRAHAAHRSLEEVARETRHALLREAAAETGADVIALGHTQDDIVETLLMRVIQGSDVHGLRGIAPRRGPFIRPMLGCTRKQVVAYLHSLGQAWREDASNEDTRILRNRVRHRLVPVLEAEFPGFQTGLLLLSRKLALSADLVRRLGGQLRWVPSGNGFSIDGSEFMASDPSVRAWSLLRLYNRFCPPGAPRRLPWRFLAPVVNQKAIPHDGILLRGHGAVLRGAGGKLDWGPDIASGCKKGYFIVVSEARSAEIREAGVSISYTCGPDADEGRGGIAILAGKVRPPIVVRSKRKGDSIRLAGGVTSVKELLIGMKVPQSERERIPILADRSGVLAVLGGALGYGTRARAGILAGDRAGVDRMVIHVEHNMEEGREQQR